MIQIRPSILSRKRKESSQMTRTTFKDAEYQKAIQKFETKQNKLMNFAERRRVIIDGTKAERRELQQKEKTLLDFYAIAASKNKLKQKEHGVQEEMKTMKAYHSQNNILDQKEQQRKQTEKQFQNDNYQVIQQKCEMLFLVDVIQNEIKKRRKIRLKRIRKKIN